MDMIVGHESPEARLLDLFLWILKSAGWQQIQEDLNFLSFKRVRFSKGHVIMSRKSMGERTGSKDGLEGPKDLKGKS